MQHAAARAHGRTHARAGGACGHLVGRGAYGAPRARARQTLRLQTVLRSARARCSAPAVPTAVRSTAQDGAAHENTDSNAPVVAGMGARGVSAVNILLAAKGVPAGCCLTLPAGEEPLAVAEALSKWTALTGCVLVGSAVEATAAYEVVQAVKRASAAPVCAVLASPFAFEGGRKTDAATAVVDSLRSVVDMLVVVDQDCLMQDASSGLTFAAATSVADDVLRSATQSFCRLLCCSVHVLRSASGDTKTISGPFPAALQSLATTLEHHPAAFGRGVAPLPRGGGDSATAACITAAAFSAASTTFLSRVRTSRSLSCVCLVRGAPGLSPAALEAATQAVSSLLPGCPLLLSYSPDDDAAEQLEVGLFVTSTPMAAQAANASSKLAKGEDERTRRTWTAMSGLASGVKEPRMASAVQEPKVALRSTRPPPLTAPLSGATPSRSGPAPAERSGLSPPNRPVPARPSPPLAAATAPTRLHTLQPVSPASTPPAPRTSPLPPSLARPPPSPPAEDTQSPPLPLFEALDDSLDMSGATDMVQERVSGRSLLSFLGLQKPRENSISARASAVLASDRAASRVIVRLNFPDASSYEGEMLDGKPHGKGRRVYSNGNFYAGCWENGLRHGWGVAVTSGVRFEGTWVHGVPADDGEVGEPLGS